MTIQPWFRAIAQTYHRMLGQLRQGRGQGGRGNRAPHRLPVWPGVLLGLLLMVGMAPAYPQAVPEPPAGQSDLPPLRIATRLMRPDAFEDKGQLVGFSIDIGQAVVQQIQRNQPQREATLKAYAGVPEILAALRSGEADLGLAAIPITSQREQEFDFSHPVLSAGLQIMVPEPGEQTRQAEQVVVRRIFKPDLLRLTGIVGLLMLIPAHILWYFERKNQDGVITHASYIPGIFEGLWWTMMALVGQANDMPKGPVGKLVALFWVFVGVIYLAYFTAGLTADLTLQGIQGNIHGLEDLQNRPVALVADSTALDYLEGHNIRSVTRFDQPEQAYAALVAQEVEAIIAPRPLLLHFAAYEPDVRFEVVGTPFLEQFYAIAMPDGSPYRTPANLAILALRENGTYAAIHRKWFGVDP